MIYFILAVSLVSTVGTMVGPIVAAVGLGGGGVAVINAYAQRRKVGADATSVFISAARELVDPLRKELATERAEHDVEMTAQVQRINSIRSELESASRDAHTLRMELNAARAEADRIRQDAARAAADFETDQAECRREVSYLRRRLASLDPKYVD